MFKFWDSLGWQTKQIPEGYRLQPTPVFSDPFLCPGCSHSAPFPIMARSPRDETGGLRGKWGRPLVVMETAGHNGLAQRETDVSHVSGGRLY